MAAEGLARLQAKFRGDRSRAVHGARAREGAQLVCPYVASSPSVCEALVNAAELVPGDVCFDLGCGDGSVLVEAAKRGVANLSLHGVDIDHVLVATAKRRLAEFQQVLVEERDILDLDLQNASVVFTFLVPECMSVLSGRFRASLRPGTRICCYKFGLPGWTADATWAVEDVMKPVGGEALVYRYIV